MQGLGKRETEGLSRTRRVSCKSCLPSSLGISLLTHHRDIGMPPLSSLSLGQHQRAPQPSYQAPQSPPQQYYQNAPAPMAPMSPPVEPHIQSWARDENAQPPEQPQPRQSMQPLQGMWNPEMGIKFAQSPGAGGGGQGGQAGGSGGPVGGKWEPNAGIRFG